MFELVHAVRVVGLRNAVRLYRAYRTGWMGIISGFYTTRTLQALFNVGFFDELGARGRVDPEAFAARVALRERLSEALDELPPKLRAAVVLRDIYDLPHEAIAAELGISESAAKVRLHRARRKLRERLYPLAGDDEGAGARPGLGEEGAEAVRAM